MTATAFLYPDPELGLGERAIALDAGGIDIGRHTDNGLSIPIDSVSRRHAKLQWTGTDWVVVDLGSSNGTFVNGQQVQSQTLRDGDVITLGKAECIFRLGDQHEDSPETEQSSGLRLVADDEDSSVILSTQFSEKTPYKGRSAEITTQQHLDIINQRLMALYQLSDVLRGETRREKIIAALMDLVFENLPADRGVALNYKEGTEELAAEMFRFRDGTENREFRLSRSITDRALHDHVAVLSRDVRVDSRFSSSESMMASDVRSAMCVPLAGKRSLMGLLVLDTKESEHPFTEDDLAFVSALATDAAMTLENLELMEENINQERLAAVGQTISGLAHNIKNILQLARGGVELMDMSIQKKNLDDIATLWPITKRSIERMQVLTHEMLDFSRQSKPELAAANVNELLRHLEEMVRADKRSSNVTVRLHCDELCGKSLCDPDGLSKAMMNLLSNAFDALQGRPDATVEIRSEKAPGNVVLRVRDNGPGIPEEILPRIFQPFFSTKGNKGNGLGLSMTRKYLEDMDAKLEVKSYPAQGCEFIVYLKPCAD